jgi:hypothetical protein
MVGRKEQAVTLSWSKAEHSENLQLLMEMSLPLKEN